MVTNLGINLLKNRHSLSEKDYLREQEIFRYSLIGLVSMVVVSIAIVSYQFVLTNKLNRVEKGIKKSTSELMEYTEANAKQIYLKSRLQLISSFLEARSVSREAIENIFSLTIPGVTVSSMSFESDNVIKTQFTAKDVLVLESLVNYLSEDKGFFIQAVSEGISRTQEGEYQLQVMLTVPKE